MTVSLHTTFATGSVAGAATEARPASKRDASSLHADAFPEIGPGFLDAVLRVSSLISPGSVGAADPRLSPSLMFEPAEPDRRASRRSGGKDDLRPEIDRYDRTSVDSRRTEMDSRRGSTPTGDSGRANQTEGRSATSPNASFADDLNTQKASSRDLRHMTAHDPSAGRGGAQVGQLHPPATGPVTASSAATAMTGVGQVSGGAEPTSGTGLPTRTSAMLVGRLLATGHGADADGLRGGAQSGALASNVRSNEPGDTTASRAQTARSSAGRGTEAGRSTDRVKNPMFDQLVRSIRLSADGRNSSARLQLNPPGLGRMDIEVSVVDDRARIVVKTQTDTARMLVHERASELVAALEQHGISVEHMEVSSESVTDRQAGFDEGFGEADDPGAADDPAARGTNRQAGLTGQEMERDGEPVEPALQLESAVVAESRLDIRI